MYSLGAGIIAVGALLGAMADGDSPPAATCALSDSVSEALEQDEAMDGSQTDTLSMLQASNRQFIAPAQRELHAPSSQIETARPNSSSWSTPSELNNTVRYNMSKIAPNGISMVAFVHRISFGGSSEDLPPPATRPVWDPRLNAGIIKLLLDGWEHLHGIWSIVSTVLLVIILVGLLYVCYQHYYRHRSFEDIGSRLDSKEDAAKEAAARTAQRARNAVGRGGRGVQEDETCC